MNISTLSQQ